MSDATDVDRVSSYVQSPIITATTRVIAPFVLTFGLFVMFHGADSSGGGFQGGVVVGTVVIMLGLAYGIRVTRDWVGPTLPVALVGLGVVSFVAVGSGAVLAGGQFLEYSAYTVDHASKYGIELVELAIGCIVSGVVVGLFFALDAGERANEGDST